MKTFNIISDYFFKSYNYLGRQYSKKWSKARLVKLYFAETIDCFNKLKIIARNACDHHYLI